ncbi:hypothetical protein H1C71_022645 [Ictidomys tridecemlineatus]|nr:hypothetical protein H1C71_022645 [Ictidomys tridecemlineatus]KAG3269779.1 hypothetical protein H1C71_022645 [Ictidomys tridecemlineatus]KAG3269780.1 hypothetical protein H1C71_022645 [Ictidomys tridecemlineatus]
MAPNILSSLPPNCFHRLLLPLTPARLAFVLPLTAFSHASPALSTLPGMVFLPYSNIHLCSASSQKPRALSRLCSPHICLSPLSLVTLIGTRPSFADTKVTSSAVKLIFPTR